MALIIREGSPADYPAMLEIYGYYVEHFPYSFDCVPPTLEEVAGRMDPLLDQFPLLIAEEDGRVLGFAYAHPFRPKEAYRWISETTIYVRDGLTRKGVGSALYAVLLPALREQGFTKAVATIGCPNERSEAFHRKQGFTYLATFPDIGYKLGGWHDLTYYALDLNPSGEAMDDPVPYRQIADRLKEELGIR